MLRLVPIVSAAALACFLAGSIAMARLDRAGPPHADLVLEGGVPATLFLPGESAAPEDFLDAPPPELLPPALVLMHGFAGDRLSMSGLARRLAGSGYAVLNIDARGHGENRNASARSRAAADSFHSDFAAAVDFLRVHPGVDGNRIAVLGHSMGAGAALDYATRDSAIDAAVMISGGSRMHGPFPVANALFLVAAGDPARTRERAAVLAARCAGVERLEPARTHGGFAGRDAVRLVEIAGADHMTIVWKQASVREIVAWLDAAFGIERAAGEPPGDPRAPLLVLLVAAFALVLPGLGIAVGRIAPRRPVASAEGRWQGIGRVAGALILVMPLLATGTPLAWIPLEVGDFMGAELGLAGLALLAWMRLRRPELLAGLPTRPMAACLAAGLALVAVQVLLQPFGVVIHRVSLTPERALAWLLVGLAYLPFALAFNLLVRRGPLVGATLAVLCGRLVVLGVLLLGVWLGVLPRVMIFMLPALAGIALLFELLASGLYAASRNALAIALVDAGWLALVTAAIMPIRI